MKFFTYILVFIFSFQAQAHNDHFLGEGATHDLVHGVLLFLLIAVTVTCVKWLRKRSKQLKNEAHR